MLSDLHPFQVLAPECTFFMCCILICTCFRCCHPICTCFRRWHLNAHVSCDEFWFEPVSGPGTCFMWCILICTCFRCWSRVLVPDLHLFQRLAPWLHLFQALAPDCTCSMWCILICICFRPWHLNAPVSGADTWFTPVSTAGTWMHLFHMCLHLICTWLLYKLYL